MAEYRRVLRAGFTVVASKWKSLLEAFVTVGGYLLTAYLWLTGAAGWQVMVVGGLTTFIAFLLLYASGQSAWQKEHDARSQVEADLQGERDDMKQQMVENQRTIDAQGGQIEGLTASV